MSSKMKREECLWLQPTKPEAMASNPLEVELLAMFRGIQPCAPLGIYSLTMESDSMLAIKALAEGEDPLAHRSNLLREIIGLQN